MQLSDFKNCDPDKLKLKQKHELMRIAAGHNAQKLLSPAVYKRALEMMNEYDRNDSERQYSSYKDQEDRR